MEHAAPVSNGRILPDADVRAYTNDELKRIGTMCSSRLPPASSVQAMFMYEMARHEETERLFQGQMFRLARAEDGANDQTARIAKLADLVESVRQQILKSSKAVDERMAFSKVKLEGQQIKVDDCAVKLEKQEKQIKELISELESVKKAQLAERERQQQQQQPVAPSNGALDGEVATLREELDVLFDERDALVTMVKQSKGKIAKLEDLVRALTLQGSPSLSGSSPAQAQCLPMQASNGQSLELCVPKGMGLPLTTAKENRTPIPRVRSFTPGKDWGA